MGDSARAVLEPVAIFDALESQLFATQTSSTKKACWIKSQNQ